MLGHLEFSAHLSNFESKVLVLSWTCYKCYLDIGTMTIESVPHPLPAWASTVVRDVSYLQGRVLKG